MLFSGQYHLQFTVLNTSRGAEAQQQFVLCAVVSWACCKMEGEPMAFSLKSSPKQYQLLMVVQILSKYKC